jgi:nicotinamide riboside transporter PnuC
LKPWETAGNQRWEALFVVQRLDYVSCVLSILSTILVGKKYWEGWVLAGINSAIICVIGYRTAQLGFIPANVLCIVMYGFNLRAWRRGEVS